MSLAELKEGDAVVNGHINEQKSTLNSTFKHNFVDCKKHVLC